MPHRDEPTAALAADFDALRVAYGPLDDWWPAADAFEVAVGALLIQQSRWTTVDTVLQRLRARGVLSPDGLLAVTREALAADIRPCGFFNQKTDRVRGLARWWRDQGGQAGLQGQSTGALRTRLLSLTGVGEETADAICAYGFDRPVFVVDAFAWRILRRLGRLAPEDARDVLTARVAAAVGSQPVALRRAHALLVTHAQRACRSTPACSDCVLSPRCAYASSSSRASR